MNLARAPLGSPVDITYRFAVAPSAPAFAKNYRVIVFDRPGFGHSDRPRNVVWTPVAQAERAP